MIRLLVLVVGIGLAAGGVAGCSGIATHCMARTEANRGWAEPCWYAREKEKPYTLRGLWILWSERNE